MSCCGPGAHSQQGPRGPGGFLGTLILAVSTGSASDVGGDC